LSDRSGLKGFWDWYEQMSEAQRAQVVGPVMNKLRAFLLRDYVRNVMGPIRSSFSMAEVLDGGVCLARVPKGILGEEASRLLGSFVVAQVWQAATHRARLGQSARVDAALYVDECQNVLTLPRSFDEMLAEARGYRLSLVLAHQHLAQLPRDLREAVSANARNKVLFTTSPEDAHTLARHVTPELSEHDLSHLGAFQAAARLFVAGQETPACTLRTRPAPASDVRRAEGVRLASARRFGRDAARRRSESLGGPARRAVFPGVADTVDDQRPVQCGIESGIQSGIELRVDPPLAPEVPGRRAVTGSNGNPDSEGMSGE
jgi:hypothetical protein